MIRRYRTVIAAAVIVCLVLVGGTALLRYFRVSEIRVVGTGIRVEIDENRLPGNLIFFPASWYERELLRQYPQLSAVTIRKVYPDVIELSVTAREPVAMIVTGGNEFLIDGKGYPTTVTSVGKTYPVIELPDTAVLGFPVRDQQVLLALNFLSQVQGARVTKITSIDSSSLRAITPELDILFSRETDIAAVDRTLQTLISGFRMKGTMPKSVDLRFQKPIVTF
jgi:hypothetical protein